MGASSGTALSGRGPSNQPMLTSSRVLSHTVWSICASPDPKAFDWSIGLKRLDVFFKASSEQSGGLNLTGSIPVRPTLPIKPTPSLSSHETPGSGNSQAFSISSNRRIRFPLTATEIAGSMDSCSLISSGPNWRARFNQNFTNSILSSANFAGSSLQLSSIALMRTDGRITSGDMGWEICCACKMNSSGLQKTPKIFAEKPVHIETSWANFGIETSKPCRLKNSEHFEASCSTLTSPNKISCKTLVLPAGIGKAGQIGKLRSSKITPNFAANSGITFGMRVVAGWLPTSNWAAALRGNWEPGPKYIWDNRAT